MAGFFNNGLIETQIYRVINGQTLTINNNELISGSLNRIFLEGTNVITLPVVLDDSTYIEFIVKNGQTTITNLVDGVSNIVLNIKNQRVVLIRHDNEYSIVSFGQVDSTNVVNSGVKFYFDELNSTSDNLNSGQAHSGQIIDITQYPSISLLAFADQPLFITVHQFIDEGGYYPCSDPEYFSVAANESFGVSFTVNGNYAKVEVINAGASSTTKLKVDVAYGVINSTLYQQGKTLSSQPLINGSQIVKVGDWKDVSIQVTSTATGGAYIFEGSNDGVNYSTISVQNVNAPGTNITAAINASAGTIIYQTTVKTKYIRQRITSNLTGGSIINTIFLK